jgi:hypothetical protein
VLLKEEAGLPRLAGRRSPWRERALEKQQRHHEGAAEPCEGGRGATRQWRKLRRQCCGRTEQAGAAAACPPARGWRPKGQRGWCARCSTAGGGGGPAARRRTWRDSPRAAVWPPRRSTGRIVRSAARRSFLAAHANCWVVTSLPAAPTANAAAAAAVCKLGGVADESAASERAAGDLGGVELSRQLGALMLHSSAFRKRRVDLVVWLEVRRQLSCWEQESDVPQSLRQVCSLP